jgi:hypothetical protein
VETGEPTPDADSFRGVTLSTLWYKWTATATGLLQVTVVVSDDGNSGERGERGSTVGVYTGTTLANAVVLRAAERCPGQSEFNDGSEAPLYRCVFAPVARGGRYWIQVETRNSFQLSWAVAGTFAENARSLSAHRNLSCHTHLTRSPSASLSLFLYPSTPRCCAVSIPAQRPRQPAHHSLWHERRCHGQHCWRSG